jgi:hypothetical protein
MTLSARETAMGPLSDSGLANVLTMLGVCEGKAYSKV